MLLQNKMFGKFRPPIFICSDFYYIFFYTPQKILRKKYKKMEKKNYGLRLRSFCGLKPLILVILVNPITSWLESRKRLLQEGGAHLTQKNCAHFFGNFFFRFFYLFLRNNMKRFFFSSFDKILVHLKLQTCFVVSRLFSAIRSFKKCH